jgi:hypothetical protein
MMFLTLKGAYFPLCLHFSRQGVHTSRMVVLTLTDQVSFSPYVKIVSCHESAMLSTFYIPILITISKHH